MRLMKKLLCLGLCMAMLVCGTAFAELSSIQEPEQDPVDQAVWDACMTNGLLTTTDQPYIGFYQIEEKISSEGNVKQLIGELYAADAKLSALPLAGVADVDWLDRRASVILYRNTQGEWQVESVNLDIEMEVEQTAAAYLESSLMLYDASACGYRIWYPAVFGTLTTADDTDGCAGAAGKTVDGIHQFFIGCRGNEDGLTAEALIVAKKKQHEDLKSDYNSVSGVLELTWVENNRIVTEYWIITAASVYHAQMVWDPTTDIALSLYSEYVMNTFSADELGIG